LGGKDRLAPRLLFCGCIESLEGANNESVTGNHDQESARKNDQSTRDYLQTMWHADLLSRFSQKTPRSSRQEKPLDREIRAVT
jgi:hypothetical protein